MKEKDIRNLEKILKKVDLLIGYQDATLPYRTMPCFVESPKGLKRLVRGFYASANLTHYLNKENGKVGVFVKNCDIPSVTSLIQEERFSREDVVLLGLVCPGTVDIKKVTLASGIKVEHISSIEIKKEQVTVGSKTGTKKLGLQEVLFDKCLSCSKPTPEIESVDILIGDDSDAKSIPVLDDSAAGKIAKLENMSASERWEFWKQEIKRCIRCYACKNACHVCYCKRCMVDMNDPRWVSPKNTWEDNMVYHIMRINHVAGRCTDCGECTRVCPVGIPLNLLTGKLFTVIADSFKQVPGENSDDKTPMTCFREDDEENFIY